MKKSLLVWGKNKSRLSGKVSILSKEVFKKHLICRLERKRKYMSVCVEWPFFAGTLQQPRTPNCSLALWTNICWPPSHRPHLFHSIPIPLLACYGTFSFNVFWCLSETYSFTLAFSFLLSNPNYTICHGLPALSKFCSFPMSSFHLQIIYLSL